MGGVVARRRAAGSMGSGAGSRLGLPRGARFGARRGDCQHSEVHDASEPLHRNYIAMMHLVAGQLHLGPQPT